MGIILTPSERIACQLCKRKFGPGDKLSGPGMWAHMQPTCRHDDFFCCPECYRQNLRRHLACEKCGCEIFYT